jgi:hypothetical protein
MKATEIVRGETPLLQQPRTGGTVSQPEREVQSHPRGYNGTYSRGLTDPGNNQIIAFQRRFGPPFFALGEIVDSHDILGGRGLIDERL